MKLIIITVLMFLSFGLLAATEVIEAKKDAKDNTELSLFSQFLDQSVSNSNIRFSENAILNRIIKNRLNLALNHIENSSDNSLQSSHYFSIDTTRCDRMFLRNGRVILVKIKEITNRDIIYSRCDAEPGEEYFVPRSDVDKVETLTGQIVYLRGTDRTERIIERPHTQSDELELEGFGSAALVSATAGLLIAIFFSMLVGVSLAILALILAGIGDSRRKQSPQRFYRNNNISIARVLAVITILITLIIIVLAASS